MFSYLISRTGRFGALPYSARKMLEKAELAINWIRPVAPSGLERLLLKASRQINALATPDRLLGYPLMLSVLTGFLLFVNYLLGHGYFDAAGNVIGEDFMCFYSSAKMYLSGQQSDLYDLQQQLAMMKSIVPNYDDGVGAFLNPPFAVLLYAPFGLLGYGRALILWWLLGLVALTISLLLLKKSFQSKDDVSTKMIFVAPVLFFPTWMWFAYGQATPFVLLILTGCFVLLRRGDDFQAGLVLGLLAFKPQLALPLALPILIMFRWSAIFGGAISVTVWCLIGFVLFPDEMLQYWRESDRILALITDERFPIWGIHSLFGFSQLLLTDTFLSGLIKPLTALLSLVFIGFIAKQWRQSTWEPGTASWDVRMAASIAAGLCLAIHLFTYDLTLLLLPFLIVFLSYRRKDHTSLQSNGPLFSATIAVYILTFISTHIVWAQQTLLSFVGLPEMAIQFSTLAMLLWAIVSFKAAREI